jgi:hypothetical protein
MSTPFTAQTLEDQLARAKALLTVVDLVSDHLRDLSEDGELKAGADICLAEALDAIDRIEVGLSARVLATKLTDGAR